MTTSETQKSNFDVNTSQECLDVSYVSDNVFTMNSLSVVLFVRTLGMVYEI